MEDKLREVMFRVQDHASERSGSIPCLDCCLAPETAHLATCTFALQTEFDCLLISYKETISEAKDRRGMFVLTNMDCDPCMETFENLEATKKQVRQTTFDLVDNVASNA